MGLLGQRLIRQTGLHEATVVAQAGLLKLKSLKETDLLGEILLQQTGLLE